MEYRRKTTNETVNTSNNQTETVPNHKNNMVGKRSTPSDWTNQQKFQKWNLKPKSNFITVKNRCSPNKPANRKGLPKENTKTKKIKKLQESANHQHKTNASYHNQTT
jgi:hypothetical protein